MSVGLVTVEKDGVLTHGWREMSKEEAEEHEREMQEIAMTNYLHNSKISSDGMMNLLKRLNLIDKDVDIHEFIKMLQPEGDENDA